MSFSCWHKRDVCAIPFITFSHFLKDRNSANVSFVLTTTFIITNSYKTFLQNSALRAIMLIESILNLKIF